MAGGACPISQSVFAIHPRMRGVVGGDFIHGSFRRGRSRDDWYGYDLYASFQYSSQYYT
jgi:hypothetical protein